MSSFRVCSVWVLAGLCALPALSRANDSDTGRVSPARVSFDDVPFDRWAAGGNHSGIRWQVETPSPALTSHQRLELTVRVDLDVREVAKRKGRTNLVTFVQLRDSSGQVWRDRGTLKSNTWTESAFVLPGDYDLEVAAWDSDHQDYSFLRRRLHAPPLKTDPLSDAWNNLPSVDWIPSSDVPDAWYLPSVQGRLNLPVAASRPVHLDVILNVTPGGRTTGSLAELHRNMEALIPALKVVTQLGFPPGSSLDVSLLDLVHQRIAFTQDRVETLNWAAMRGFLGSYNPAIVDVATLESSWKMRGYFENELRRIAARHEPPDEIHAVIVLSAPAFFDAAKSTDRTEAGKAPGGPGDLPSDDKIFYIRYRPIPPEVLNPHRRLGPGLRLAPPVPRPMAFFALALDDLEKPLQPENSRIFDAISPEQFRRILAAVMDQIAKL